MKTQAEAREARLLEEIQREFPGFRLIRKDTSRSQRLIHHALVIVTCGQMRDYLGGYHTTLGQRVYVTPEWERLGAERRYRVLRHERVHMRQFARYGWVGMAVLYLLLPLPLGVAYFRARFEKEAYAETLRAIAETEGVDAIRAPRVRDGILGQFTGPAYGWMWPFRRSLERWYDGVIAELC